MHGSRCRPFSCFIFQFVQNLNIANAKSMFAKYVADCCCINKSVDRKRVKQMMLTMVMLVELEYFINKKI
jgi:hypothetical protein